MSIANLFTLRWGVMVTMLVLSIATIFAADIPALKPPFSVSVKPLLTAADAADVPTWQLRVRVLLDEGKEPQGKTFTFYLSGETLAPSPFRVTATGSAWSDWLDFDRKAAETCALSRTGKLSRRYPVLTYFVPRGVVTPARIAIDIRLQEGAPVQSYTADLFSAGVAGGAAGEVGIHTWRDTDGQPHVALRGEFNQGYWDVLKALAIPAEERPKLFPICAPAGYHYDSDRFNGTPYFAGIGITVEQFNPPPEQRDLLPRGGGLHRATNLMHVPIFDFTGKAVLAPGKDKGLVKPGVTTPADLEQWAVGCADEFLKAGFQPQDIGMIGIADAPIWSYPKMLTTLGENPPALQNFHDYLKAQGLTPLDVGATGWEQVLPLGRSRAVDLPSRRLFYWTMRFFAWDCAHHFANVTHALEKATYLNLPVFANTLPIGPFYHAGTAGAVPPHGTTGGGTDADAATGGPDLFEFGRLRGSTLLWGRFGGAQPAESSSLCAQLHCAAEKGGVQFGGAITTAGTGDLHDGVLRNILTVVGSGGKGLLYSIGPTEHFTYNAYRENPTALAGVADAHRMIGKAEDLLWPGKRPRAQVAILAPRSAELWNTATISAPVYLTEAFNLYRVLQRANVPADFVEEDDLSPAGLAPYRVLYVTEPNIPAECQKGLSAWVQNGGTLAMSLGAGTFDRYNDPCTILTDGLVNTGKGQVVRFAWKPGAFSEVIRDEMFAPVQAAKVILPVILDRPMIETPILLSEKGTAVTLLNWTGQAQKGVRLIVQVPFNVKSVESIEQGILAFNQTKQGITCVLPLGVADIVLLKP